MSWTIRVALHCDSPDCLGVPLMVTARIPEQVRGVADDAGWASIDGRDLCPLCQSGRPDGWDPEVDVNKHGDS